jgi:hypothetical protein
VAFKGLIAAAASVALMTGSTMAAAQTSATAPAATQEVAPAEETVEGEQLRGGFIIPLLALIAVLLGLCAASVICGDGDDPVTSP